MGVYEIKQEACKACMRCVQNCSVHALKKLEEGVSLDQGRCIVCGKCFADCAHGAVVQRSHMTVVKEYIRAKRKVIISVDPACRAYLPQGVSLEKLAAAVQNLGIWDVADASEAYCAVSKEYVRLIQEKDMDNLIFSSCPVVQNLIEQYYPELLSCLAPVASPMIAHGRMLKRDFTSAAVVYVSTCAARIAESRDVRHSTEINGVISIGELLGWLEQEGIDPACMEEEPLLNESGGIGSLCAFTGGLTECLEYLMPDHGKTKICVDGLSSSMELLDELKNGNITGCIIEMNACEGGCLAGTMKENAMPDNRGRFQAALEIRASVEECDKHCYIDTRGIALANPTIDFSVGDYILSEEEIQQMLLQMGVGNPRLQMDCGLCGYETCRSRAEAILAHREPMSICRHVIDELSRDVYSVLYESLPMAAVLIDENQCIVDYNREAASLFGMKRDQEKYIFEFMDPEDIQYVLGTGLSIRHKKLDIPGLYLRVEASLVPLKPIGMVLGLFSDVTEEEEEESRQLRSRLQSVEMAQKVIDKQMMVAQQIAFLLGETTAETKVTLNQLKSRILDEEDIM